MDNIVQLQLTISGYFYGTETSTCVVSGDHVEIVTEQMLDREDGIGSGRYKVSKNEFMDKLSKIHIEEWEKKYYAPVLDGIQWDLGICYDGSKEPVQIYGSNAYPDNFKELVELTKIEEENICD